MSERITQAVKSKYGSVATSGLSSNLDGVKAVAEAFGYTPEELVKKRGTYIKKRGTYKFLHGLHGLRANKALCPSLSVRVSC